MNKLFTATGLFILLSININYAQLYPSFQVTAYDSTQSSGYYFTCPYTFGNFPAFPPGTQHQLILDSKGDVVYYRNPVGYFGGDFKLQPNGMISFAGPGKFYLMDSTFTIVDSVTTVNGVPLDFHDLQILSNGHYLLMGLEGIPMDLSSYNLFNGNSSPGDSNATVLAVVIQELDSAKNVVFEWHSIDHFNFEDVDTIRLTDPVTVDWTHSNAVELDSDGNYLVSHRHFNEITKVSRADSSVIWRLGGNANQFNFVNDSAMFLAQHDCRRLPNGNLSLFDNGVGNPLHYGSAKEYELDETNMTATLVWSHNEGIDHWSASQGNVQRLANGNTLISYGDLVPTPVPFNVVDSLGNKVFEIQFNTPHITYRSFNFPSLPFQLHRPQVTCTGTTAPFYLTADSGHASYLWSNGETTQSILADSVGDFFVFVPYGDSGYISSEKIIITDTNDPCGLIASVSEREKDNFVMYPNPATDHLEIITSVNVPAKYEVFDMYGRVLVNGTAEPSEHLFIDLQDFSQGVYIFRLGKHQEIFIKQ